ncbi:hypothetical protein F5Y05DRAFT_410341 [Hypoxylon sp. FL0543]|nr:hypothetical protein F5Y05DRAFT_410341 [Hypoxylon sp. FL0543]
MARKLTLASSTSLLASAISTRSIITIPSNSPVQTRPLNPNFTPNLQSKMQYATVALALFGTALAAPAAQTARQLPQETDTVTEFGVHKTAANVVDGVSFHVLSDAAGAEIVCSATASQVHGLPSGVYDCADASYHFQVLQGADALSFKLRLYRDVNGVADAIFGDSDIATTCHAAGLGAQACVQGNTPVSIHLDNSPK